MLMAIIINQTSTPTAPAGWTVLDTGTATAGDQPARVRVWWKAAASGDIGASYVVSHSVLRNVVGIVAYSGADITTAPVDVQSVTSSDSTSFTGPAAATTSVPSTLVSIFGSEAGSSDLNQPVLTVGAGPTVRLNQADRFFAALAFAEDVQSSPGAGTARTASNVRTSSWVGFQVTLAPPTAARGWVVGSVAMN